MMNYANVGEDSKVFFQPGDVVLLRQDLDNKPKMIVHKVERNIIKNNGINLLRGVKVRWFTKEGFLLEAIFSTKDLIKIQ